MGIFNIVFFSTAGSFDKRTYIIVVPPSKSFGSWLYWQRNEEQDTLFGPLQCNNDDGICYFFDVQDNAQRCLLS